MKPVYNEIFPATGAQLGGFCKISIMPVEWLNKPWKPNFNTDVVPDIDILPGKDLITLNLLLPTFKYSERPKRAKGTDIYDLSLTALTNDIDQQTLQVLNTYRYHQWLIIFKDIKHRTKIAGNKYAGFFFDFGNEEDNEKYEQQVSVSFSMQSRDPAKFFGKEVEEIVIVKKLNLPGSGLFDVRVNEDEDGFIVDYGTATAYPDGTSFILQRCIYADFSANVLDIDLEQSDIDAGQYNDTFEIVVNTTYYYRMKAVKATYQDSDWAEDNAMIQVVEELLMDDIWLLLRAEDDVGFTPTGEGNEVHNWIDQAQGIQFDFNTAKPFLIIDDPVLHKPVVINAGRPTAKLVNSNDLLPDPANGMTIYLVAAQEATNDTQGFFFRKGNGAFLCRPADETRVFGRIKSNGFVSSLAGTVTNGQYYTFRLRYDGATNSIAINGVIKETANVVNTFWTGLALEIFSGTQSNKRIAFMAIYQAAHTPEQMTLVEAYLQDYYGHY